MNFKWRTHCFKCDKKRGAEGGAGAESDPPLDTGSTTRKQKRTAKERLEELATKAALAAVQALAAEIDDDDDDGEKGKEKANAGRADEENRIECKVCMDKPKNTMLTLCGHYDLCELCAAILTQCPICKRNYDPSKDTVRVFES